MPFEVAERRINPVFAIPDRKRERVEAPNFLDETIPAALRIENPVGSLVAQQGRGVRFPLDPDFNPLEDVTGYEGYEDLFVEAKNADHLAAIKSDIDRETKDRATIAAAGTAGDAAALAAGLVDPMNLLPGGVVYKGGKLGFTVAKTAASTAAAGTASVAASEVALHATQNLRTAEESAVAIGVGTLLAGTIGGAISAWGGRRALNELSEKVSRDFERAVPDGRPTPEDIAAASADLSAARVPQTTLEDESLVGALGLEKLTRGLNPVLRLAQSPSKKVREVSQGLIESPLYVNKNLEGVASEQAVETLAKEHRARLFRAVSANRDAYRAHREQGGALGKREFAEEVGRALRRGDTSDVPGVEAAARAYRSELYDPLKDAAIKEGLLPEGVEPDTAVSYLSRLYNRERIVAREDEFRAVIREWSIEKAQQAIRAERAPLARAVNNIRSEIDELRVAQERDLVAADRPSDEELPEGVTADDVRAAIGLVQQGAPPRPQSLTQFLAGKGGLKELKGELAAIGITNRTRPGFVRKQDGLDLDDAAFLAWEEGFIRTPERPTVREFLSVLDDDFNQRILSVRQVDDDAARALEEFEDIRRSLDELGVDFANAQSPLRRRVGVSEEMQAIIARANTLRSERRAQKIQDLELRLTRAEAEANIEVDPKFDLEEYAEEIADSVIAKLKVYDAQTQPMRIAVAERGPLAERVFDIPDERIEDFLESDADLIAQRYERVMSADIELQRKFGSTTMQEQLDDINTEYADMAKVATTEKERRALEKARREDIRDIEAMRDLIRGTYRHSSFDDPSATFARVQRVARDMRYMALLGGVTISSFPDIARPVMTAGLYNAFAHGFVPFVTSMKARKMVKAEAQLAGQVTERVLQGRVAALAELADPYAHGTAFERFVSNSARVFSNLNLLNYWNDTMKQIASGVTMSRLVDLSRRYSKIKPKDKSYLSFLGIDEVLAGRIAKQFKKHGDTEGGVRIANSDMWDDEVATRAFRAAINKDVDSTIVTPGVGDKPIFMNTELGRTVGQFKSFMFAANQRVMLRAAQRQDKGTAAGMAMMVAMGAMVYWLKTLQHDPKKLSDDPRVWLAEGLDRSGLIPVMMEANNIAEKVGFPLTFRSLSGGGVASRYASRSLPEALLGPSLGQTTDLALTLRAIFAGEASESDISAFRRLLPFQNLFYIRGLFDVMQDSVTNDD